MDTKRTFVGKPMTVEEFKQLMDDMYKKDENGVPLWKKVFGIEDENKSQPLSPLNSK